MKGIEGSRPRDPFILCSEFWGICPKRIAKRGPIRTVHRVPRRLSLDSHQRADRGSFKHASGYGFLADPDTAVTGGAAGIDP
jgi:hypothetical protein